MLGAILSRHAGEICTFMHQKRFPVETTPKKIENKTITGYFWFAFEGNSCREIT